MWDLVPQPGIDLKPPVLGVWSLGHWTTREFPWLVYLDEANCHGGEAHMARDRGPLGVNSQ